MTKIFTRKTLFKKFPQLNYKGEKIDVEIPLNLAGIVEQGYKRYKAKLDYWGLITGQTGSGKSNLGDVLMAYWWYLVANDLHTYSLEQIHFRPETIFKVTDSEDNLGEPIKFDEAIQGGGGVDVTSVMGRILKKMAVTKRRKRHFFLFLVDELQEISYKYVKKANFLIDVTYIETPETFVKGYYVTYNNKEIRDMWWLLKERKIQNPRQFHNEVKIRDQFRCKYYGDIWFTEDEYDTKKAKETSILDSQTENPHIKQRNLLLLELNKHNYSYDKLAKLVGLSKSTIAEALKSVRTEGTIHI